MYLSSIGHSSSAKFNSVVYIRASTFADTPVVRLLWMGC